MTDDQRNDDMMGPHDHPLYQALKRLAGDLSTLFQLASKEDMQAWNDLMELAKREIGELEAPPSVKRDDLLVYQSLVQEVYDHLTQFVEAMKSTQERYKRLATRDLLTGLYNRNYFNETIVRDVERAKRYGERLSFILIDVNDFKQINDTYGHLHGDGVLRACAEVLKRSIRRSDFLCRFGGDEFVIVTPQPACTDNRQLFERIAENLAEWNAKFSAFDYRLSFSMGCAAWEQGRDIVDVLHEADQEMYKDKKRRKG
jgi:diguanylate cyclase (GGDEF)-like protein